MRLLWLYTHNFRASGLLSLGTSSVLGPELGDRHEAARGKAEGSKRASLLFTKIIGIFKRISIFGTLKNCLLVVSPGSLSVEAGHWRQVGELRQKREELRTELITTGQGFNESGLYIKASTKIPKNRRVGCWEIPIGVPLGVALGDEEPMPLPMCLNTDIVLCVL